MQWLRPVTCFIASLAFFAREAAASAGRPPAAGELTAILGLDDACHRVAEASESSLHYPACAFGALQHSALSRLAAPLPSKSSLNGSRTKSTIADAGEARPGSLPQPAAHQEVSPSLLAQLSSDRHHQPKDVNATPGVPMLPGPQFPHRGRRVPSGWKTSQERWIAHGDVVPDWAQMPEVGLNGTLPRERASLVAPVGCIACLLLCIICLVICQAAVITKREDTQKMKKETLQTRPAQADMNGLVSAADREADSRLPSTRKGAFEGKPVSYMGLFRFATRWDIFCMVVAALMACVHGALMPAAFYNVDKIFQCLYFPNDDGSIPPVMAPHTKRDAKVWHVVRIYFAVGVTVGIARAISLLLMSHAAKRQGRVLRTAVFQKLLRQGPAWHDSHDPSEISARVSSCTYHYQNGITEKFLDTFRAVTLTVSSLLLAAWKDWKLTLVMGVTMPVSAYAFMISLNVFENAGSRQLDLYTKAGAIAENTMQLVRTVYAFGGQGRELKRFEDTLEGAERKGNRLGLVSGFCFGVNNAVLCFALSMGIYAGATWIVEGWEKECWMNEPPFGTCKTGGSVMACIYTVMWGFIMGLGTIPTALEGLASARSSAQMAFAIVDEPLCTEEGGRVLEQLEGHVVFDNVHFWYAGREASPALQGLCLRISAGSTCALVGRSGSGKTTLVNLLLRFYSPRSGTILIDGQDIQGLDVSSLRAKMALVEQEPTLFGTTIFENIMYGCSREVQEDEVERAAKLANAHDFIMKFPERYQTQVGEQGTQLSSGQKQRVAIARALVREPAILVLDEATSALDAASERLVQDALDRLMQNRRLTTLIVAHRLSTVQVADKIAVVEDGRVVEEGTHDKLLEQQDHYAKLVKTQLQVAMVPCNNAELPQQWPFEAKSVWSTSPQVARKSELGKLEDKNREADCVGRLLQESRPDFCKYSVGVTVLAFGALLVPWYMMQFAQTLNLFNRPPAVMDPDTSTWVADYNEGEVMHAVTSFCIFMQLCGAAMIIVHVSSYYCLNCAAEALLRRLRQKAFKAMLRQEMAWHDEHSAGELSGRLAQQVPKLKLLVGNGLASGAQGFLGIFAGLGLSLIFSWRYTLCVLGVLPILGIGTLLIVWSKQAESDYSFGGLVCEGLSNIKTVAAYDLEKHLLKTFNAHLDKQGVGERGASLCFGLGMGLVVAGIFLILGFVALFANFFVSHALMAQDRALVACLGIVASAIASIQASVWLGDRATALKAADGLFDMVDRAPLIDSMGEGGKRPQQASLQIGCKVEFEAVHFSYISRPEMPVFQGLSLVMERNTSTALVGPSGCGKSTTVSLLQRFYDPQAGAVRLNGVDIRELNIGWLRAEMGLVQQEPVLFGGTILENIRYGNREATDEQIIAAARAANAHAFICSFPLQYGTDVGSRGHALSGGQRQRLALARALVREPALLLLDEATTALDAASERQVQEALDELLQRRQRTALIIAHRLSTIQGVDQICVLQEGRLAQRGSHQELIADQAGLYAKLVGQQQVTKEDAKSCMKPQK